MTILPKIKKVLLNSRSVLIVAHTDPDGDTLGSALAIDHALRRLGLKTTLFCPRKVPRAYAFLPGADRFKDNLAPRKHFDAAVALDCGDLKRTEINLRALTPVIINIDHHLGNPHFGDLNLVGQVAATAELVYHLLGYLKVKLDPPIAACLYAAIMTDTGNFKYENTTSGIFSIASRLVEAGADPHRIALRVYENRSLPAVKLLGWALRNFKVSGGGRVGTVLIPRREMKKIKAREEDTSGIIDYLRGIAGIEAVAVIRELGSGRFKVNLRSKTRANVYRIARMLGGGGHRRAAGCLVNGSAMTVQAKLLRLLGKEAAK